MTSALESVQALAPWLTERAPVIDRARRLGPDDVNRLVDARCLRLVAPRDVGGDQRPLPEVLAVIDALARHDAAVAWTVAQAALGQLVAAHLPRETFAAMCADGPDVWLAGSFAPKGRAARDGDSWRVTGTWPFATGAPHARWIYVHALVVEQRRVQMAAEGLPLTRVLVFPAAEVELLDTWHSLGLRGTASGDVAVHDAGCDDAWSCSLAEPSRRADAFGRLPLVDVGGLFTAAVAVGLAHGAVGDAAAVAIGGKRPAFSRRPLADSAVFRDRLGEAHMHALAAEALLAAQAGAAWSAAERGEAQTPLARAALRATSAQVTALAVRAVDAAQAIVGGTSAYAISPLERRLRDIHTATQHTWNGRDPMTALGAVLVGAPDETLRFEPPRS